MEASKENLQRLLASFEALSELGPALTAERDFSETATLSLRLLMDAIAAREAVLFRYTDRPAMLASVAILGFTSSPHQVIIPLLPKHTHNLLHLRAPVLVTDSSELLSSSGNFPPQLLRCIAPLKVRGKLVGAIGLGARLQGASYGPSELDALGLLSNYIALALQNNSLAETLAQRVSENLKLISTVHSFYDNTLEAFAAAIDFKHVNIHGHSIRVGRYASGIADALGIDAHEIGGIRAAGFLHDIGKIAVDKALFAKPTALAPEEWREMAEHPISGYEMVRDVQFPWPSVPDVVRWHHERADGSGYPDHLRLGEMKDSVRIMALADSFDAMTSERPYRRPMSVGAALRELVRLTPQKFDPITMQALLIQIRRDSVSSLVPISARNSDSIQPKFIEERLGSISPSDIDLLASTLHHKLTGNRVYSA